jgi:UDP-N-acetylglucosamine 2-epimerase (non-hydrolysing)
MANKRIFLFVGTTAELIKLVPIIQEFNKRKLKFMIVASGQNDIRFEEFATEIGDVNILHAVTPKAKGSSMVLFSIWAVRTFFSLLKGMRNYFIGLNKSNSLFIVHGDTVSSLMGALVASLYGLKLVHIESGLRSFNFFEPFPEELCRYIVSRLSDIHFCPNAWAVKNLKHVKGVKVNTMQNTLIESFWTVMKQKSYHHLIKQLTITKKHYFVLVVHRQEHVMFGRKKTREIVKFVLSSVPKQLRCIFLVHDLSENFVNSLGKVIPQEIASKMTRVERLSYLDFMHLLAGAEFLVTDGGSNQEEMYYMGKPCLLLRNRTERIEGLGENVILSRNKRGTVVNFFKDYRRFARPPVRLRVPPSKLISQYLFG